MKVLFAFSLVLAVSLVSFGQEDTAPKQNQAMSVSDRFVSEESENDPTAIAKHSLGRSRQNSGYSFPDKKTRFKRYVNSAVGPTAFVGPAISAGFQTAGNNPPEWEKTTEGYFRRFASNVGENVIEETTKYALSEALKQDPKYYKCECDGVGKRTVHALKSGFTARNRDGDTVFSPPKVVAPFVANVASTTLWYPERFTVRDGMRRGGYSLLFNTGFNLVREFVF